MTEDNLKIEQIKGGAVIEMINTELQTVFDDIADPNKEGKSVRKVTVELVFSPSEDGLVGTLTSRVKSSLGKQRDLPATVYFGQENGKGICAEQNRNQPIFGAMEVANQ
jgi:hypothetical protein